MVGFPVSGLREGQLGFWFQVQKMDGWVSGFRFKRLMVGFLVPRLGYGLLAFWFQAQKMDVWLSGSRLRRWMVGFLVPGLEDGWLGFWFQAQEMDGWVSGSRLRRWMVGFLVPGLRDFGLHPTQRFNFRHLLEPFINQVFMGLQYKHVVKLKSFNLKVFTVDIEFSP